MRMRICLQLMGRGGAGGEGPDRAYTPSQTHNHVFAACPSTCCRCGRMRKGVFVPHRAWYVHDVGFTCTKNQPLLTLFRLLNTTSKTTSKTTTI